MLTVDNNVLSALRTPDKASHKGQNGRVLIIAGSMKFHGALLLAVESASRIVDMVYVYTSTNNRPLIEALKSDIATFIPVLDDEIDQTVELVDAILIGPGLDESDECIAFIHRLLKNHKDKKIIVDATALWHIDPALLHENCILTPHSREFEHVFKQTPSPQAVQAAAAQTGCMIVLTGTHDYISNGDELWENTNGNVGLTKGGTGDVLASTITALAATNTVKDATLAGTYLTSLAGDRLHNQVGTFYNAEDVIRSMGDIWKEYIS